jgi:hypothetical protein
MEFFKPAIQFIKRCLVCYIKNKHTPLEKNSQNSWFLFSTHNK